MPWSCSLGAARRTPCDALRVGTKHRAHNGGVMRPGRIHWVDVSGVYRQAWIVTNEQALPSTTVICAVRETNVAHSLPTYGYSCCHALKGSMDGEACLLASPAPGSSMPCTHIAQMCWAQKHRKFVRAAFDDTVSGERCQAVQEETFSWPGVTGWETFECYFSKRNMVDGRKEFISHGSCRDQLVELSS